jgi:hypothetical protein
MPRSVLAVYRRTRGETMLNLLLDLVPTFAYPGTWKAAVPQEIGNLFGLPVFRGKVDSRVFSINDSSYTGYGKQA